MQLGPGTAERGKRDVYCDKQIEKAVTALNCMLKGLWREVGSGGIRKVNTQLIWNLSIEGMIEAQFRSYLYGIPKVSTFIHHNKLTSRIVSKLLKCLTILNQALIYTPIPNLMGVIQSKSMISQAFQACHSIEGCLSDCCVLSYERVGYMVGNIHQLNLSPRPPLIHSRELHLQPQELLR